MVSEGNDGWQWSVSTGCTMKLNRLLHQLARQRWYYQALHLYWKCKVGLAQKNFCKHLKKSFKPDEPVPNIQQELGGSFSFPSISIWRPFLSPSFYLSLSLFLFLSVFLFAFSICFCFLFLFFFLNLFLFYLFFHFLFLLCLAFPFAFPFLFLQLKLFISLSFILSFKTSSHFHWLLINLSLSQPMGKFPTSTDHKPLTSLSANWNYVVAVYSTSAIKIASSSSYQSH